MQNCKMAIEKSWGGVHFKSFTILNCHHMNKKLLLSALIITSIIAGCSTENLQGSFSGAKSSSTTKSGLKLSIASPAVDDQLVYG